MFERLTCKIFGHKWWVISIRRFSPEDRARFFGHDGYWRVLDCPRCGASDTVARVIGSDEERSLSADP
jgi:hypothetical protein